MGLEPKPNRTNRTRTLVFERAELNPNALQMRQEPEENRTQTISVLSHSTHHHTNGQRTATLVNTKTSQSFLSYFTKWASALLLISGKQRRLEIIVMVQNALRACRVLCYVVHNTADNIAVTRKNY